MSTKRTALVALTVRTTSKLGSSTVKLETITARQFIAAAEQAGMTVEIIEEHTEEIATCARTESMLADPQCWEMDAADLEELRAA